MTKGEIKQWLEWFVEINNYYEFSTKGDLYERDSWQIYAFKMPYGYVVEEALQLVLQEEIVSQGWFFHLRTHDKPEVLIKRLINNGEDFECIATSRANTILEAFMLAFRQAWEATK